MRILVVNLQSPGASRYIRPSEVGSFLYGRSLADYPVFVVSCDGAMRRVELSENSLDSVQRKISEVMQRIERDTYALGA